MAYADDLRYCRLRFRRQFTTAGVLDLSALTTAANALDTIVQEEVLLIGNTFEGGGAQGQAKFSKLAAATVLEELILEADPTLPREVSQTQATFRPASTDC
jgi:hypothetical protein